MPKPIPITEELVTDEILRVGGLTNIRAFSGQENPTSIWTSLLADGQRAIDYYEDIEEKDDMVGGALETRKDGVLKNETKILPASDSAQDQKWADFAIDVFKGIPDFENVLYELLDAVGKGMSVAEILWILDGGEVRIGSIKPRPQQIFSFGDFGMPQTGDLRLSRYMSAGGEIMPAAKFLVHTFRPHKCNRWGSPLVRKVFWLSWFKRQDIKFWLKFVEKGTGTVMARYPSGGADQIKAMALEMAQAANEDTAFAIPDNAVLEVLEKVRQAEPGAYMELADGLCNNGIARRILGQTLTSKGSEGGSGSLALGQVHMEVKQEKIEVDSRSLMSVINDQLMRYLILFNGGPDVIPPKWMIEYQVPQDLQAEATKDKILVDMGLPYPVSHAQFKYQIPEPQGNEPVLKAPAPPLLPPSPGAGAGGSRTAPTAGRRGFADDGIPADVADGVNDVEKLVGGSIQEAARAIYAPMINRLIDQAAEEIKNRG